MDDSELRVLSAAQSISVELYVLSAFETFMM